MQHTINMCSKIFEKCTVYQALFRGYITEVQPHSRIDSLRNYRYNQNKTMKIASK